MAWRDSRTHRKRLFLFMSSIILGIAALVAITSLSNNVEQAVNDQSKDLLGADLVINSRRNFTEQEIQLLDSLGGDQSKITSFSSMIYFPKNGGTRLVRVRSIEGDFPYYGNFETVPPEAATNFRYSTSALLEEALMLQFDIAVGDSVHIGAFTFQVAGALIKIPGEAALNSIFAPRVYIPMKYLEKTRLIQPGSLAFYQIFFKFANDTDVEKLIDTIKPQLTEYRLRSETVQSRKENLGQALANFYQFLNLIGFIALLLGCIGVVSAVNVYIRQKLDTIAILRCLGANTRQSFLIYLIQAGSMGLLGSVIGTLLGIFIQTVLPIVFGNFIPVDINFEISWAAVLQGVTIGFGMAMLFALIPLISVRKISPLLTLRSSFEETNPVRKDRLRFWIYATIAIAITAFSILNTKGIFAGVGFALALFVAFGLLVGLAKLVMKLSRKFFPKSWPYVWRQSFANLYRPNNQTLTMILSLGLGTFLISTLFLVHDTLINEVELTSSGNKPNMILWDIQTDQINDIEDLVLSSGLTIVERTPIVTMRIAEVKGKTYEEIRKDSTSTISKWALRREFRSTYRDRLTDAETLIEGQFRGIVKEPSDTIFVSLEADIAENLEVNLGDEIVFDVQGVPIQTVVGSVRKVDWRRIRTNFFITFPTGVLEDAPQIHALVTRVEDPQKSADFQRALVQAFPNVSVIDLALILSTLDSVLSKIGFVIRFMASFSIFTGLTVLLGAVSTGRYQRIQESVLLRTLGASKSQIIKITVLEYFYLGSLAVITGLLLSLAGSWALTKYVFNAPFFPSFLPLIIISIVVIGLTILLGMLNSRGVVDRPPLEVLRVEV